MGEVSARRTRRTSTTPRRLKKTGRACTRATASRCRRTPTCSRRGGIPRGDFAEAVEAGTAAGGAGVNAAVKAQVVYANYLEKADKAKVALFEEAAAMGRRAPPRRAEGRQRALPLRLRARPLQPGHLGGEGARAGLRRQDQGRAHHRAQARAKHADAHIAYGAYQAEVIDKVGGIVAGMTYGAKKDSAIEHYEKALKLFPESPIAHIEYANGLLMLFGKARIADADEALRKGGANAKPADAMERLDVELAKSELE